MIIKSTEEIESSRIIMKCSYRYIFIINFCILLSNLQSVTVRRWIIDFEQFLIRTVNYNLNR